MGTVIVEATPYSSGEFFGEYFSRSVPTEAKGGRNRLISQRCVATLIPSAYHV
jgi:hypothetical protein